MRRLCLILVLLPACTSSESSESGPRGGTPPTSSGGATSQAGAAATGGAGPMGGQTQATGGASTAASGGTLTLGGAAVTGGTTPTAGGQVARGGALPAGGSSVSTSGGTVASGGSTVASGGSTSGGTPSSGGTSSSAGGGTVANGGKASGGLPATGGTSSTTTQYWGEAHTGNFWLGPVDYVESEWHNACAPSVKYPAAIQQLYGNTIMGLANEVTLQSLVAGSGQLCDVCAELKANGKTLIAHVVTFGEETGPNDIDVSPEIDSALSGATSRTVTWQFITCPTAVPIQYTFDGREWTNTWFFRVWVRNARVPVAKVEYRLGTGAWTAAEWQGDGAWQAANADFSGGFALRVTSLDGQTLVDTLPGLNTFDPDVGVSSQGNFE